MYAVKSNKPGIYKFIIFQKSYRNPQSLLYCYFAEKIVRWCELFAHQTFIMAAMIQLSLKAIDAIMEQSMKKVTFITGSVEPV